MNKGQEAVSLRTKPDKTEWIRSTIRIPADVHKALKVRAAQEGRGMAEIIEGLIRAYLVGAKP